jgi:hypothetical protein
MFKLLAICDLTRRAYIGAGEDELALDHGRGRRSWQDRLNPSRLSPPSAGPSGRGPSSALFRGLGRGVGGQTRQREIASHVEAIAEGRTGGHRCRVSLGAEAQSS